MVRQKTTFDDLPLTPEQEAAIAALVEGKTLTEAAQAAGVGAGAVTAWLEKDARFVARYNRRRRDLWDRHNQRLMALRGKALEIIEGLLKDDCVDPVMRLKAAALVLRATATQERPKDPIHPDRVQDGWRFEL